MADVDRVDGFLSMMTDDEIFGSLNENMTLEEKVKYVYQCEIMKTAIDGCYSGMSQKSTKL